MTLAYQEFYTAHYSLWKGEWELIGGMPYAIDVSLSYSFSSGCSTNCYFATTITDKKGKQRKRYDYDKMMTPYEKLKSLDQATSYLKENITFELLDKEAYKISDNQLADEMNLAKKRLFKKIFEQKRA